MTLYEPREDSEFLAKYVRDLAFGRVVDIGTGTGILAFAALENEKVTKVTAVDVNQTALDYVRNVDKENRIILIKSDMFLELRDQKFDTIICNPPYLPGGKEVELSGGENGYEWSVRFLRQAKVHLSQDGQILFLFSNLTNRDRIDAELKRLGLHHEELAVLAMFFERLYVYRIWSSK